MRKSRSWKAFHTCGETQPRGTKVMFDCGHLPNIEGSGTPRSSSAITEACWCPLSGRWLRETGSVADGAPASFRRRRTASLDPALLSFESHEMRVRGGSNAEVSCRRHTMSHSYETCRRCVPWVGELGLPLFEVATRLAWRTCGFKLWLFQVVHNAGRPRFNVAAVPSVGPVTSSLFESESLVTPGRRRCYRGRLLYFC